MTPRAAVLARPLQALKGVGARRAADLAHASLETIEDLLLRFPIRYEDRRHPQPLASLVPGTTAAVLATITGAVLRRTRRPGFTLFEATLRDASGSARAVWFNQRFLRDVFRRGQLVALYGKVEQAGGGLLQITSPQYEIVADAAADAESGGEGDADGGPPEAAGLAYGRIVPIYERIGTLTPRIQRSLVAEALADLPGDVEDPLPRIKRNLGIGS